MGRPRHHPDPVAAGLTVVGLATVLVGAFLPWVATGTATRSSFAAVRTAEALGLVPDGLLGAVARAWYLLPAVASLVVVGLALDRPWVLVAAGSAVAGATTALAVRTLTAPVEPRIGPWVALGGAALLAGGLVADLRATRAGTRPPSG